jgi:hypothetical protein
LPEAIGAVTGIPTEIQTQEVAGPEHKANDGQGERLGSVQQIAELAVEAAHGVASYTYIT